MELGCGSAAVVPPTHCTRSGSSARPKSSLISPFAAICRESHRRSRAVALRATANRGQTTCGIARTLSTRKLRFRSDRYWVTRRRFWAGQIQNSAVCWVVMPEPIYAWECAIRARTVQPESAPQLYRAGAHRPWPHMGRDFTGGGVAVSTTRRFATAPDAEADGVLALIGWLGVAPEQFVINSKVAATPLPRAGDGFVRVDMALLAALRVWPGRARAGGRTTIQKLVIAAQASGATIASLTQLSPL